MQMSNWNWIDKKKQLKLQNGDLVSGSGDNTIKIWNPVDGPLKKTLIGCSSCVWVVTRI
jgi:WD40 repeat protein